MKTEHAKALKSLRGGKKLPLWDDEPQIFNLENENEKPSNKHVRTYNKATVEDDRMKYSVERMSRAFKTYQLLSDLAKIYRDSRPKGRAGIAVDDDPEAISYQRIAFRLHRVESYLRGQPTNWFYAKWIDNEEAERRIDKDILESLFFEDDI